jgi:hypothetical protein
VYGPIYEVDDVGNLWTDKAWWEWNNAKKQVNTFLAIPPIYFIFAAIPHLLCWSVTMVSFGYGLVWIINGFVYPCFMTAAFVLAGRNGKRRNPEQDGVPISETIGSESLVTVV